MTEAGGTTTFRLVNNAGAFPLYELKNSSVSDAEVITIPTASPVTATSLVIVVGALSETSENQLGDGELTIEYVKANRAFTVGEGSLSDKVVRILFYVVQE